MKLRHLLCFALMIAFTSGSASAVFIVRKIGDSRVDSKALTIDGRFGQSINGQSFQQDALITHGDYQYVGYYNASRRVCIARRKLPSGEWDIIRFEDYRFESNDAHNTISIGICPTDGTIHIAFDNHADTLNYRVSRQGVAIEPDTVTWSASLFGPITSEIEEGIPIIRHTYPRFWMTPDGGLQFCYRRGGAGNGDRIMLDYDPHTGTWKNNRIVDSGKGEFNDAGLTTSSRCSYPNGYEYGPNGKLHVTWVWREGRPSPGGNHSILYAYSEDGGNTWHNNAGHSLDEPPNINSPGLRVMNIPWGYGLMNTQAQAVDSKDRIHTVMWHLTDASIKSAKSEPNPVWGAEDARRYHHYWRDETGAWQHHELPGIAGNRPKLFFDSEDNAYLIFGRKVTADPTDWGIYFTKADLVIMAATARSGWKDWREIHVEEGPFMNEMLGDVYRWKANGVLSVMVQQSPAKPHKATPLRILDFTIEKE